MSKRVAIVTGISGVGKSWLLNRAREQVPMQLLSAGQIILDQISRDRDEKVCYDDLRTLDIAANQQALIAGFHHACDPKAQNIVLDAHAVVDTPNGLLPINPTVFATIGASLMVFLEQEPVRISENRLRDPLRTRPLIDLQILDRQQNEARRTAEQIAKVLGIPFHRLQSDNADDLLRVLKSKGNSEACQTERR